MKEQINESNRLLFAKKSIGFNRYCHDYGRTIVYSVFFVIGVCILIYGVSVRSYEKGFNAGIQTAIDPRNPSEALEMACVGLWVGEQHRKYQKK